MNPTDLLAQTQVFSSLQTSELKRVVELLLLHTYVGGEFVTHLGEVWPYLLFVAQGEFQALKESGSGRSFVIESSRSIPVTGDLQPTKGLNPP